MAGMDPAVKKETGYIAVWVVLLSLLMEAVFLIIRQWDLSVLFGNLGTAVIVIANFFILAWVVSKAVAQGQPEKAAARVKASAGLRLIGMGALCALLIGVLHTNIWATLIPLLFPRIGLLFRPMIDRKRGVTTGESEGSDLID